MLTVSVHGITLHAKVGLYPQEKISGNDFEIDVDVKCDAGDSGNLPFIDYAVVTEIVYQAFREPGELLEQFATSIHATVKETFSEAVWVKVAVRKLNPPMGGTVRYSQVVFEK